MKLYELLQKSRLIRLMETWSSHRNTCAYGFTKRRLCGEGGGQRCAPGLFAPARRFMSLPRAPHTAFHCLWLLPLELPFASFRRVGTHARTHTHDSILSYNTGYTAVIDGGFFFSNTRGEEIVCI
ncbi:hypothetical protein EVAR_70064_1 [Eumeta japonica]|uniref:Uncharacterized protein n=1 Tax=Eumeta variegata TaxID=151549 RepID=A0A4C2AAL2_EUMVA|nr:hypothetical protein EVAR_70064_1 [Eumeta japonica]